jgi:putative addiction module component (TIGR02574 family)
MTYEGRKIMATIRKKLKENIESLSDIEKLELVDSILMTLDRPDPKIDRIWAEEARKRWKAYKSGKMETVPYDQVMSKYKNR